MRESQLISAQFIPQANSTSEQNYAHFNTGTYENRNSDWLIYVCQPQNREGG